MRISGYNSSAKRGGLNTAKSEKSDARRKWIRTIKLKLNPETLGMLIPEAVNKGNPNIKQLDQFNVKALVTPVIS